MKKPKTAKLSRAIYRLALALVIASLGNGLALANGTVLPRQVLSGGASDATAAGGVSVRATLGQPMVGPSGQGLNQLCAGFWCGTVIEYKIYLPLTLRNA